MSNDMTVTATRLSSAENPGLRCMLHSRFTNARCGTTTPFGLPVDPEV